jgi:hypothetical protein
MATRVSLVSTVQALLAAHRAQAALIDKLMLEIIKALQAGVK